MSILKSVRIGAVSSILSGLAWLALTPFMATIGICQGICTSWADKPLVIRTLGRAVAHRGWLSFASPDTLYFGYGRYFFLVYALIIPGLIALHRLQIQRHGPPNQLARRAYLLLLVSLMVAALGDFTSYGIGVFSELAWRFGFGAEVLAWLGVMLGSLLYGIVLMRQPAFHPATGWLLVIAALLMPATFFDRILVHYAPNAQLLPFALVWPTVGVVMLAKGYSGPRIPGGQMQ